MKKLALALALALFAPDASAQGNIHLKDGRIIVAKQLRRDRDTIMATIPRVVAQGEAAAWADVGFPLTDIFKLEFQKPSALDAVPALIAEGKVEEALKVIDPVVRYYEVFRDAPGSWWVDAVPLQIQALFALKRDKEAVETAEKFARLATDPENRKLTRGFTAVSLTRKGDHESALRLYDEAARNTKRLDMLSIIAVNKGESLVVLGEELKKKGELDKAAVRFEEALLAFLRVPALYPSQKSYMPQSTLGAARAYLGIEDFARARTAIKELKQNFPATSEAKEADAISEAVDKREKQLADPDKAGEPKPEAAEKPAA